MGILTKGEEEHCRALFERVCKGKGQVGAGDAVSFLRGSALPDAVLHSVWGMSDPEGKGFLDFEGFSTAFKLVALAQAGTNITQGGFAPDAAHLGVEAPPPSFGAAFKDLQDAASARRAALAAQVSWVMTPEEKARYDAVFAALERDPDGSVSGKVARQVLINSKLPMQTLGQIWECSDVNGDGKLDADEFAIAMCIVYKCLAGAECPKALPPSLLASLRQLSSGGGGSSSSAPAGVAAAATAVRDGGVWVVSESEMAQYATFFASSDKDKDGLVSGQDVRAIFKSSKLDNSDLARIWDMCDLNQTGLLTLEQFGLAMHLISQRVKGMPLPDALTPDMVPPSCRAPAADDAPPPPLPERTYDAPAPLPPKPTQVVQPQQPAAPAPGGSDGSIQGVLEENERLRAQRKGEQERLDRLRDQGGDVSRKLQEARAGLEKERAALRAVQGEASAQQAQVDAQEAELRKIRADIASMQAEEAALRRKLDTGKQQLKQLVIDIKAAKAGQAKAQGTVGRLQSSNDKVEHAVKQYGNAPSLVAGSVAGGGSAGAGKKVQNDPFAPSEPFAPRASSKGKSDPFGTAWN